jgi:hypothetical protein
MQELETEIKRRATHPINPFILNRWSPRSMTGEELKNEDIMSLLKLPDGLLLRITINLGDLFMRREVQNIGTDCLTYWLKVTRVGRKILRY